MKKTFLIASLLVLVFLLGFMAKNEVQQKVQRENNQAILNNKVAYSRMNAYTVYMPIPISWSNQI